MQDAVMVALANALTKNSKPIKLAVGEHAIDTTVTLKIRGTVKKGADNDYTPTVDIPLLSTMALLLEKSGFQREHSKGLLIEAMQEALALNVEADEVVAERVKDIEAAMEHVREVTGNLPKKTRSGPTNVAVEIIDATPIVVG